MTPPHRNRRLRPVAAAVAAIVALCGCQAASGTDSGVPVATDACAAPEFPAIQAGLHLIGDREPPVPYSSSPPTSGWHRSGVAGPGVADRPLSEPVQVGLLEEGLVVVTHGALDTEAREALLGFADAHPDAVAVTPYADLGPGEVAMAGWGVLQDCEVVDVKALETFVDFYAGRTPAGSHASPSPEEDGAR